MRVHVCGSAICIWHSWYRVTRLLPLRKQCRRTSPSRCDRPHNVGKRYPSVTLSEVRFFNPRMLHAENFRRQIEALCLYRRTQDAVLVMLIISALWYTIRGLLTLVSDPFISETSYPFSCFSNETPPPPKGNKHHHNIICLVHDVRWDGRPFPNPGELFHAHRW